MTPIAIASKFIPPPQPDLPVVTLTLNLTKRQAQDILLLTEHVGGEPLTSTRKVFDEIRVALRDKGFRASSDLFIDNADATTVHFRSQADVERIEKAMSKKA